ncbi:MAG: hypothetical protein Q8M96_09475, partial [Rubrivivax sp.]|nr:hypothetical protein [Rubrivivax sp.]
PPAPVRRAEAPARPAAPSNAAPARTSTRPAEAQRPRAETPAPVAPPPAAAVPAGPGPDCGSRDGVRYLVCMERECGRADFAGHPSCQRWKQ